MTTTVAPRVDLPAPPGPRYLNPFGFIAEFRRDPLGMFFESFHRHGDIVRFRTATAALYLFAHPDHVKHVLQANHHNYGKGKIFARLRRVSGNGLVFSEGDTWRRQRRLSQPAFHSQRVAAMGPMMTDAAEALVERWRGPAARGEPLEIASEMSSVTLDIVARALFGADLQRFVAQIRSDLTVMLEYANFLLYHVAPLPLWVPTPRNVRMLRAMRRGDRVVSEILAERRRNPGDRGDLLSMLMAAHDDETGEGMDEDELRAMITTFIVAGHETTAVTLAWTWYLLSRHPEVERRLHAELDGVLGGRVPSVDDLPRLVYTRCVIDESMRLYPAAWGMGREAREDDEVGGYRIAAGSGVFLSPYLTHRHPEFWDNPEGFDPERFLPERAAGRPAYAFFPFGGGPRVCIGAQLSLMEAQLLLATIGQRVRLDLVPGHPVIPNPIFTLRPRHGIAMTIHAR